LALLGSLGVIFELCSVLGGTLGSLLEPFGCTFRVKKQTGAPKVPQEAPPPKFPHPFGPLWEVIFHIFIYFVVQKVVLKHVPFFLRFWGRPERFKGWAHMQSVRAGSIQTHFSDFVLFLKNGRQQTSFWVNFGSHFRPKPQF
jgi:hypothetical protein